MTLDELKEFKQKLVKVHEIHPSDWLLDAIDSADRMIQELENGGADENIA